MRRVCDEARGTIRDVVRLVRLHLKRACERGLTVQEIAPGNFVHRGHDDVATRENGGNIANIGFIVGTRCVAVIDTGGTLDEGRALRIASARRPRCLSAM